MRGGGGVGVREREGQRNRGKRERDREMGWQSEGVTVSKEGENKIKGNNYEG